MPRRGEKQHTTMAIAIREIPTLTGQSAVDFINEAEKYAEVPVPRLTAEEESRIRRIEEAYQSFVW